MIVPGQTDEKVEPPPPYSFEDSDAAARAEALVVEEQSPPPPVPPKRQDASASGGQTDKAHPPLPPRSASASTSRPISPIVTTQKPPPLPDRSSSEPSIHSPSSKRPQIEVTSASPVRSPGYSPLLPPNLGFSRTASASTSDLNSSYQRSRKHSSVDTPRRSSFTPPSSSPQPSKAWRFGSISKTNKSNLPIANDARNTVHEMVRDLIRPTGNTSSPKIPGVVMPSARQILKGCREACVPYSLNLWELLQEKYIEGHTPLYWSIISQTTKADYELIVNLLSFSTPLSEETISDMRQACMVRADQRMFQYMRSRPEWRAVYHNSKEGLLFGERQVVDVVNVDEQTTTSAEQFAVGLELRYFQRRMRALGKVDVEFIAKGRLWSLSFSAVNDKGVHTINPVSPTWALVVSLMEISLPTHVDSRLIVYPSSKTGDNITFPLSASSELVSATKPQRGQTQTISLTLKETDKESYEVSSTGAAVGRKGKKQEGSALRALRDAGGRYIDTREDILRLRWEVSMTKPEDGGSCVIC